MGFHFNEVKFSCVSMHLDNHNIPRFEIVKILCYSTTYMQQTLFIVMISASKLLFPKHTLTFLGPPAGIVLRVANKEVQPTLLYLAKAPSAQKGARALTKQEQALLQPLILFCPPRSAASFSYRRIGPSK